jgi:death-on-curing protein
MINEGALKMKSTTKTNLLDSFPHLMEVGVLLGAECEIEFVSVETAVQVHDECVSRFGGASGVRDINLLESALFRPIQMQSYQGGVQIHELAASLCAGVVKNHAFIDGNKRAAFFCLVIFLKKNGLEFKPDVADAVSVIKALASGGVTDADFSLWVKSNTPGLNVRSRLKP